MFLKHTVQLYFSNFKVAIAFALLLIFVLPFTLIPGMFVSAATIFVDYDFIFMEVENILLLIAAAALSLSVYAILVSLMVFAVRRDLSSVKLSYYVKERIWKFAFKYFVFLSLIFLVLTFLTAALVAVGIPILTLNFLMLLVVLPFIFVPQAVVVDEASLLSSIHLNFDFIYKNFEAFLYVLIMGAALVVLLTLLEFALETVVEIAWFVSALILLVFVVPFLEVMKTQLYMHRFELVSAIHKVAAKK